MSGDLPVPSREVPIQEADGMAPSGNGEAISGDIPALEACATLAASPRGSRSCDALTASSRALRG